MNHMQKNKPSDETIFDLTQTSCDSLAIAKLSARLAAYYRVIPIALSKDELVLASSRPNDLQMRDELGLVIKEKIRCVYASEKDIDEAMRKYYGIGAETIEKMMGNVVVPAMDLKSSVITADLPHLPTIQ